MPMSNRNDCIEADLNAKKTASFLDLPFEIRTVIYRHLLVASSEPPGTSNDDPFDSDFVQPKSRTFAGQHMLELGNPRFFASISPAILLTCKRIRAEASPFLYSENTFHRRCPLLTSNLLGIARNIQSLDLWLEQDRELGSWLDLLAYIDRFKNLRFLSITFGEDYDSLSATRLGKSLTLARRVCQIKGLTRLTIEGFYGKHWPTFFQKHMDCEVVNYAGFKRPHPRYLSVFQMNSADHHDLERLQAREFRRFQETTADLDPADDGHSDNDKLLEDAWKQEYYWQLDAWEEDESDEEEDEYDWNEHEQHEDTLRRRLGLM